MIKTEIIVGDTLNFLTTAPSYPASASWLLTYKLIPRAVGPAVITIQNPQITAEGDDFRVTVPAATTTTWTAGEYSWQAYVTKGAERYVVDTGVVTVKANPAAATVLDTRSHARRMMDLIELALEGHATAQQLDLLSSTIGTRTWNRDVTKLLPLRDKYKWEVFREERAEKLRAGQPDPRIVAVRLNRV